MPRMFSKVHLFMEALMSGLLCWNISSLHLLEFLGPLCMIPYFEKFLSFSYLFLIVFIRLLLLKQFHFCRWTRKIWWFINYQLLKKFHPFLVNIKFHRLLKFLFSGMDVKSWYSNQFSIMLCFQNQLKQLQLNKMKATYLHFLYIPHLEVNDFLTKVF